MFYFIRNVFSNHIVYDCNIIICRLVTRHESNNYLLRNFFAKNIG
jgi:hypothetical protein